MEKKYIELVLKEAEKAYNSGEVPVGAVIIKNNKIIAKAHNMVENKKNSIMHAEIIAITKASKKIRNWRLNNCDMYVSLEPCDMCKAVISEARIKKVYYILKKTKCINNTVKYELLNDYENNYFLREIKEFFINKR